MAAHILNVFKVCTQRQGQNEYDNENVHGVTLRREYGSSRRRSKMLKHVTALYYSTSDI